MNVKIGKTLSSRMLLKLLALMKVRINKKRHGKTQRAKQVIRLKKYWFQGTQMKSPKHSKPRVKLHLKNQDSPNFVSFQYVTLRERKLSPFTRHGTNSFLGLSTMSKKTLLFVIVVQNFLQRQLPHVLL